MSVMNGKSSTGEGPDILYLSPTYYFFSHNGTRKSVVPPTSGRGMGLQVWASMGLVPANFQSQRDHPLSS
jgi:hypothetical protein